jgi:hypothetical protein
MNREISYDPSVNDNNSYMGFDNKNEQPSLVYESSRNHPGKSSLLFPLPKREFF